jgi:carbonic anhydrase/acetyltransferase-like protein (isoleucine patch superfamily)
MLPSLIVFGDKTANEVLEAANLGYGNDFGYIERIYFEEADFTQNHLPKYMALGVSVFYNIGIANVEWKQKIEARCNQIGWKPITIVHPTAFVSPSAQLAAGIFVGPMAVISTNAVIAKHSIVHLHSSIGHDSVVGEYSVVLPGARISGAARIGDRVLIGSNAFVNAGVRIGNDCQVDALTYVSRDLEAGHLLSVRAKGSIPRIPTVNRP